MVIDRFLPQLSELQRKYLPIILEMADWYSEHKRYMKLPEMRAIISKHLKSEDDVTGFHNFIATTEGADVFKRELRDAMSRRGYVIPPEYLPAAVQPTGTCYEDAWRFIIKEEEGMLVHGSVWSDPGKRIEHAWVETETGFIWEPQRREFFKKDHWEKIAEPIEEARYTPEQAAIMAARSKHLGPWTVEEREKFLDNPVVLRTSEKWDTTVRHLGYEPVSVPDWIDGTNILKTDRQLIDESQERLKGVQIVSDKQLGATEMAHLRLARAIARDESGPRKVKNVWAAIIPPASDRVRTAGLYGTITREIYINLPQFIHARHVVDTDIHELAHHRSGGAEDGSEEHLKWVSQVAGNVVKNTASRNYDDILKDPSFVW